MQVLQILLILVPGVIATQFYEYLKKSKLDLRGWVYHMAKFDLLIFWIVNILQYIRGWNTFDWTEFTVQFLLKCIPLTLVLAFVLPAVNLFFDSKFNRS